MAGTAWPLSRVVPATPTLTFCIEPILAKCKTLYHIKQLQAYLITLGHSHLQFFTFRLIRFCTLHLSNIPYARSLFNSTHSPNVYLYSAMINAYVAQCDHMSVFALYREMVRKDRPRPNHFVYPHVLRSSSELWGCCGTEMVHTQIVKTGFGTNPVVETALVDGYVRFGADVGTARYLFDEMSERNAVTWTAMISGYARLGMMGDAVLLFEEMPEGLKDVPAWNSVIAGCTQNGLFPEAVSFLRRMLDGGGMMVRPNQVTFACALSAFCHTGMLQLGKEIHGYIYRRGLGLGSYISNALVDFYGKCGFLKQARYIFDGTRDKSLTLWNSMINGYALHGQSDNALDIFEEMVKAGEEVRPDEITFMCLLNACRHGGLVERGYYYFDLMDKVYGIEPQTEHYGCIVDLLGRAGRFHEVMDIINGMKVEADEAIWGSLLNGCKIHSNVDLAELSLKKLIEMDPNNGGYMSMLANLYVELAKWDEVRGIRKMMKEQNVQKIPGCSWIEMDWGLHQFYSADCTHPRADEIYSVLESLFELISQGLVDHACEGDSNLTY